MKTIRFFLLLLIFGSMPSAANAQFSCSGLERVDIYLGNKLIATATPADAPVIKLDAMNLADTITLHAFTDWDGLRNSTVDIKDDLEDLMDHLNSNTSNGYEAVYVYVFNRAAINDPDLSSFGIFLNMLCEKTVETEEIATVKLSAK